MANSTAPPGATSPPGPMMPAFVDSSVSTQASSSAKTSRRSGGQINALTHMLSKVRLPHTPNYPYHTVAGHTGTGFFSLEAAISGPPPSSSPASAAGGASRRDDASLSPPRSASPSHNRHAEGPASPTRVPPPPARVRRASKLLFKSGGQGSPQPAKAVPPPPLPEGEDAVAAVADAAAAPHVQHGDVNSMNEVQLRQALIESDAAKREALAQLTDHKERMAMQSQQIETMSTLLIEALSEKDKYAAKSREMEARWRASQHLAQEQTTRATTLEGLLANAKVQIASLSFEMEAENPELRAQVRALREELASDSSLVASLTQQVANLTARLNVREIALQAVKLEAMALRYENWQLKSAVDARRMAELASAEAKRARSQGAWTLQTADHHAQQSDHHQQEMTASDDHNDNDSMWDERTSVDDSLVQWKPQSVLDPEVVKVKRNGMPVTLQELETALGSIPSLRHVPPLALTLLSQHLVPKYFTSGMELFETSHYVCAILIEGRVVSPAITADDDCRVWDSKSRKKSHAPAADAVESKTDGHAPAIEKLHAIYNNLERSYWCQSNVKVLMLTSAAWGSVSMFFSSEAGHAALCSPVQVAFALQHAVARVADRAGYQQIIGKFWDKISDYPLPRADNARNPTANLEQSMKDLKREHGIVINGFEAPLGTDERLSACLNAISAVVRQRYMERLGDAATVSEHLRRAHADAEQTDGTDSGQSTPLSSPGSAAAGRETSMATRRTNAAGLVEDLVAASVCDIMVAASRTMTGGDSFAATDKLFAKPGVVFITAESGAPAPIEITVGTDTVIIDTINHYRACHLAENREDIEVWALIRTRTRERVPLTGMTHLAEGAQVARDRELQNGEASRVYQAISAFTAMTEQGGR